MESANVAAKLAWAEGLKSEDCLLGIKPVSKAAMVAALSN